MVYVKDFIDFNTQSTQRFSLPKTVINQIFDNSSLLVLQKLLKICKYFKALHLQKGKARINTMFLSMGVCSFNFGSGIKHYYLDTNITAEMKNIAILNCLVLHNISQKIFHILSPKFDLSNTLKFELYLNFEVTLETIKKMLHPSIKFLKIWLTNFKDDSLPLIAFQKCPKMNFMNISTASALTKDVFKEMILAKRKSKLQHFGISEIEEIDFDDFVTFIETKLTFSGWMYLTYNNIQKYNSMAEAIRQLSFRQSDPKRNICLQYRTTKIFMKI